MKDDARSLPLYVLKSHPKLCNNLKRELPLQTPKYFIMKPLWEDLFKSFSTSDADDEIKVGSFQHKRKPNRRQNLLGEHLLCGKQ